MTPYEILTQAQNLIRDPAHGTHEAYARNSRSEFVEPDDEFATCWCSLGAVFKVTGLPSGTDTHPVIDLLESVMETDVAIFNDDASHAEVMAAFDKARELARA